jgi:hypothetical protein
VLRLLVLLLQEVDEDRPTFALALRLPPDAQDVVLADGVGLVVVQIRPQVELLVTVRGRPGSIAVFGTLKCEDLR